MNNFKLSIAIPTFNRRAKLKEAVESVLCQLHQYEKIVELIIIDNCSSDDTLDYLKSIESHYASLKIVKNPKNYGFDGNTIRCLKESSGDYVALLSDDDKYTDGCVKRILDVVMGGEYSLILLNYQSFGVDGSNVNCYAPQVDKIFKRAYDVMRYPSVGHFSGFVYKNSVASECLTEILASDGSLALDKLALTTYRRRGVYLELAARTASKSTLSSYFIGKPYVFARENRGLDICAVQFGLNKIREYSTDYFEHYRRLYLDRVISDEDFAFGERLAYAPLLRICILSIPSLLPGEAGLARKEIRRCFKRFRFKKNIALVLLLFAEFKGFRSLAQIFIKK